MPRNKPFRSTIGLYERIVSDEIENALSLSSDYLNATREKLDKGESHIAITHHLANVISTSLASIRGDNATKKQRAIANDIVDRLELAFGDLIVGQKVSDSIEELLEFRKEPSQTSKDLRPETPLGFSTLLTGSPDDPSPGSQLRKEAATCDRVDILCSFIRWSGLRLLMDELRRMGESSSGESKIRVITTSYMGATDPKAIDALLSISTSA